MAIPVSSISTACDAIVDFVRIGTDALAQSIKISVGSPSAIDNVNVNRINLFFYRFEPSGFQAGTGPEDIWRVSVHCLISFFGDEDTESSAGEKELRMLGQVMRIFHEKPVLDAVTVNNEATRLQVLFRSVTDEQLNQIWSIQGDTGYRPSLVYEFTLLPVIPTERRVENRLVGSVGSDIKAAMPDTHAAPAPTINAPLVQFTRVDTRQPRWAPQISWVFKGQCQHTLSFDVDEPLFAGFEPMLWIAGDPGTDINLSWEVWNKVDGWKLAGPAISKRPFSEFIDPENIPATTAGVFPVKLAMPVVLPPGPGAAQALLYASRELVSEGGAPGTVRSNPLLISFYRNS